MIRRLLCLIGWHDWTVRARDNHTRLTRSCCRCRKSQELKRELLVLESWQ